jgi:hypothetical protein
VRRLVLALAVLGCSNTPALPPAAAQEVEQACQRALGDLRAARDAGEPCEAAKARVREREPLCELNFHCPSALDGGAE